MLEPVRFFWNATRGSRLRPWRSPYLRWRVETYSGLKAEEVGLPEMLGLAWGERRQVFRYLRWLGTMRKLAGSGSDRKGVWF